VETIDYFREVGRLVQECLKVLHRVFFREIQKEFLLQQFVYITAFNVRDICINHEGDEVEDEVCTLPKDAECGKAEVREARIVLRMHTAHAVNHLFANLDGGWIQFWIVTKYVAEVDVEEMT